MINFDILRALASENDNFDEDIRKLESDVESIRKELSDLNASEEMFKMCDNLEKQFEDINSDYQKLQELKV